MTRTLTLAALLLGTAAPLAASALTDGWDAQGEMRERQWRKATLDWAKTIHPQSPNTQFLQANITPPPREMWCPQAQQWDEYCEAWDFSMKQWLHHYLDIHYDDPLPLELPPFPKECPSSCDTF